MCRRRGNKSWRLLTNLGGGTVWHRNVYQYCSSFILFFSIIRRSRNY